MKILFQLTIIISAGYGASVQSGFWNGTFNGQQLCYYTILSNFIIFIYYSSLLFHTLLNKPLKHRNDNIRGALTLMITITGLIYHTLLAPQFDGSTPYGIEPLSNVLIHTYVPLAVLIDWIFFVTLKDSRKLTPFFWLSIPLGYWILSLFYASFKIPFILTGSYYAYFFIDINQLGLWKVLLNVLLLSCGFLLLGYALKWLKQIQSK
ncbi:Pr6Pr family membrane protein [Lactococcus petauri]|uniref:Pr6Pr family membrane protein n=1 Tax=Lactococcus petauri TaxID=1940789 RepID=UPI0038551F8C